MKRTLVTALLLGLCTLEIFAQVARLYTTHHGLKTNNCHCVDIDSRGIVWVGGLNMLGLFDGNHFQDLSITSADGQRRLFQSTNRTKEQGENKYWICSSQGLYLYDAPKASYQHVFLSTNEDSIYGYGVNDIIDYPNRPNQKIVTTDGYGIYVLNTQTLQVDRETTDKLRRAVDDGFAISPIIDRKQQLWVGTTSKALVCVDMKTMKRKEFEYTPEAATIMASGKVSTILETTDELLIGTNHGLLVYDSKTNTVRKPQTYDSNLNITSIIQLRDRRVLIGTDGLGLWELKKGLADDTPTPLSDTSANFELTYGKVMDMEEDNDGNVIAFFLQKGLVIIPPQNDNFHYHPISPLNNGKNATSITSMALDEHENYWVATDGCGVFTTYGMKLATAYPVNDGLNSLLVQDLKIDRHGTVWASSYGGGIQYLEDGRWTDGGWLKELNKEFVMTMFYNAASDQLLVGTNGNGIFCIDIAQHTVNRMHLQFNYNAWISSLMEDTESTLWFATANGLYKYNLKTTEHEEIIWNGTRICRASAIVQDGNDVLIAYDDGLLIYNLKTRKLEQIGHEQGLTTPLVRSINTTDTHIWLATRTNIVSIDKKTRQVRNYSSFIGYDVGEFHSNSVVNPGHGYILFGGDNGIICFVPKAISNRPTEVKPIYFTDFKTAQGYEKLDANIFYAKDAYLKYEDATFTIGFSSVELGDPDRIHYDYMLEGLEDQWHVDNRTFHARYSSLPAGTYTFRVRAYLEDNPTEFSEKSIKIHVSSPWYATIWAFMVYTILAMVLIYFIYQYIRARKQQKEEKRKSAENDRMKEAKLNLFTSITHELRSPLTMIESPLKQLMAEDQNPAHQSLYLVMKRNCDRLLGIVKQITDIRKIDAGQLTLKLEEQDYVTYSNNVFEQFKGVARVKNIQFVIEHEEETLPMMMDVTHFEKIITNLLSNAFKFTPEGGTVRAKSGIEGNKVVLHFINSGSHLNEEDINHLWERFYQGSAGNDSTGSGIGLNLVYKLVKMHHGSIEAKNLDGNEQAGVQEGVMFTLHFPYFNAQRNVDNNNRTTLLLVDDDTELIAYLTSQLEKEYNIITAFSGNSAWKQVLVQRPDAIVTDHHMADGDGMELCQRMKSNPDTDNIPVIMLTGEGDEMLQLHSLNIQVDHYLEKPVNMMLLRSAINQVLKVRENMRNKARRTEMSNDMPKPVLENAEDKLFNKVNEAIKNHLDNSEFSVQQLSEEVGISRVHLNRKMKERYGVSPNVFIKSFRLKQAAYLLANNSVNVSEVAYKVGFSSHSYFTTSFHDYFGMSPKEFVTFYSAPENSEALQKLLE